MGAIWKVYVGILFFLIVWSVVGFVFATQMSTEPSVGLRVDGVAIWFARIVSLAGVFAFAFRRRFLSRGVWKIVFFVSVLLDMYECLALLGGESHGIPRRDLVTAAIAWEIMMVPKYLALFFYGWRSNDLWVSGSIDKKCLSK